MSTSHDVTTAKKFEAHVKLSNVQISIMKAVYVMDAEQMPSIGPRDAFENAETMQNDSDIRVQVPTITTEDLGRIALEAAEDRSSAIGAHTMSLRLNLGLKVRSGRSSIGRLRTDAINGKVPKVAGEARLGLMARGDLRDLGDRTGMRVVEDGAVAEQCSLIPSRMIGSFVQVGVQE